MMNDYDDGVESAVEQLPPAGGEPSAAKRTERPRRDYTKSVIVIIAAVNLILIAQLIRGGLKGGAPPQVDVVEEVVEPPLVDDR